MIREKLNLFYTNLQSMPYVGGNECSLIESYEVKTKFIHDQGWKRYLLSDFIFGLWWSFVIYKTRLFNCMSINGEEVQVIQSMTFKFGKKTTKMKYSKYLFSWYIWEISDFKVKLEGHHVDGPQRCIYKDSKRNQLHMEYCTDKHMPIT